MGTHVKTGKILVLLLVAFLLSSNISYAKSEVEPVLVFGIVPQQSASKTAENWNPLLRQLSKITGYTIRFATAKDIPTFEKQLAESVYDLAYMNPYHYTVFHKKPGYLGIAKEDGAQLKSIIVTRKDSPYQKLQDLHDLTLAFPAPSSFAATVLPLIHFAKLGINVKPKYVESHASAYYFVSQGIVPAAGGVISTYETLPDEIKSQLRIIWTSKSYTPHAIAAHPRLPKKVIGKISKALVSLNEDAEGKTALAAINFKGFTSAKDKDWDDIRALHITNLDHLLKE